MDMDMDMDLSLRLAVQNVLRGPSVDGPIGRAISVLQCVYGREGTYYQGRNSAHSVVVGGVLHTVPDAVDLANGLLKRLGLIGCYIAYPGAKSDPRSGMTGKRDLNANDNLPRFEWGAAK
ncbi:hypothetical protein COO20_09905 [Thalassospira marina]|uniref:Uncharacterized protein n=2 Tax=Thalassospira marina TaxID=2048283 RepID=A0A2N3KV61_9PROT|nr:hypothetical protein COO20_09905 [Thalassospira marina]